MSMQGKIQRGQQFPLFWGEPEENYSLPSSSSLLQAAWLRITPVLFPMPVYETSTMSGGLNYGMRIYLSKGAGKSSLIRWSVQCHVSQHLPWRLCHQTQSQSKAGLWRPKRVQSLSSHSRAYATSPWYEQQRETDDDWDSWTLMSALPPTPTVACWKSKLTSAIICKIAIIGAWQLNSQK